jgi:hypothetical protein
MKTSTSVVPVAVVLAAGAWTLFAQWTPHPTDGPKTPDGKVDLTAPAPRTADGKPDFSGIWDAVRGPGRGGQGKGKNKEAPPPPTDGPPVATFGNIGANFKDGLPLQPWAAELLAKRKADNSKDNPDAHCLPMGLMQFHTHPQPRKIIQTPKEIVIIYEANHGLRQIYTDGRSLPANDPDPWWYGYSIGHWDGDTMVVETTGFRDDVWLDIDGTPLTNKGKLTERFHRVNYGTLNVDVTVEDPTMYTAPFTVKVIQRIMPDTELIEFICQENDRSGPHLVGK